MKRTLSLKREVLTPLTTDELAMLRGGQLPATLDPAACLAATTEDSVIFCSNGCMTGPGSCFC